MVLIVSGQEEKCAIITFVLPPLLPALMPFPARVLSPAVPCRSGAPLPPRYCVRMAAATRRQGTWLEVQQHALLAAADLLMHTNDAVHLATLRPMGHSTTTASTTASPATGSPQDAATAPSSLTASQHAASHAADGQELPGHADAGAPGGSPPRCPPGVLHPPSLTTEELVGALWARHSSLPGGAFTASRHTMSLLPGLLHNAGAMYAYPMSQVRCTIKD